jgi:hypothetical protein
VRVLPDGFEAEKQTDKEWYDGIYLPHLWLDFLFAEPGQFGHSRATLTVFSVYSRITNFL